MSRRAPRALTVIAALLLMVLSLGAVGAAAAEPGTGRGVDGSAAFARVLSGLRPGAVSPLLVVGGSTVVALGSALVIRRSVR